MSNFFGISSLNKAITEKDPTKRQQLVQIGCESLRKDILRADLNVAVPLLIKSKAIGAAIKICVFKSLESDNLDVKASCCEVIREIILAIYDSMLQKATDGSQIAILTRSYVNALDAKHKQELFKNGLDALKQEPRFLEDILNIFICLPSTNEQLSDFIAERFSPSQLGSALLRFFDDEDRLKSEQSKKSVDLSVRLLRKVQQDR